MGLFESDVVAIVATSLVGVAFYQCRYKRIASHLQADDLFYFAVVVMGLNVWNIVLSLDLPIKNRYNDYLLVFISIASIVLFRVFSKTIFNVFEYISFATSSDESDEPMGHANTVSGSSRRCKRVVFNDKALIYNYLDANMSLQHATIKGSLPQALKNCLKRAWKPAAVYAVMFALCVAFIPSSEFFVSTKVFYSYHGTAAIKTDHVLYAMMLEFVTYMVMSFYKVLKHPQFSFFPYYTSIATIFIWFYASSLLLINTFCMFLFNDILAIARYHDLYENVEGNILSILSTKLLIEWVNCHHNDFDVCAQMEAKLQVIGQILTQSCRFLNIIILGVVPFVIWIIVIEFRLKKVHSAH